MIKLLICFDVLCLILIFVAMLLTQSHGNDSGLTIHSWAMINMMIWVFVPMSICEAMVRVPFIGFSRIVIIVCAVMNLLMDLGWNILGSIVLYKLLASDFRKYSLISLIICGYLNVYLYFSLLRLAILAYNQLNKKNKEKKFKETLIKVYDQPLSIRKAKNFVKKYEALLRSLPLLNIEESILRKYCTIIVGNQADQDTCIICLMRFRQNDEKTKVQCTHIFHLNCLVDWYKIKPNCPMCGLSFREELLRVYSVKNNITNDQNC